VSSGQHCLVSIDECKIVTEYESRDSMNSFEQVIRYQRSSIRTQVTTKKSSSFRLV
jgi:hypothetical protein